MTQKETIEAASHFWFKILGFLKLVVVKRISPGAPLEHPGYVVKAYAQARVQGALIMIKNAAGKIS